jgi:hypothetical protein
VTDVAFVDDHVSVTGWPAWTEAGEALRATLGGAGGGASCAAAMGFFPLAISASATKPNKTAVRIEEEKRIVLHSLCNGADVELQARNAPPDWSKDCGIARRCKLFLGPELERGTMVQGDLFVWPPMEPEESSQRQTCKLSLTLSESTTRDGLRLPSRTPQAALRPMY